MPKHRNRRRDSHGDWEANETEESNVDDLGGNNTSNRADAGRVRQVGNENEDDHTNSNISGGGDGRNRGSGSSQRKHKHNLGPWSEAVSETVQIMGAAQQAFKHLQERFASHADDIRMIEETKESLEQLREECAKKDVEIKEHATTITTLSSMSRKREDMIRRQKEEVEEEKKRVEQEKLKLEKRVTAAVAAEKLNLNKKSEELVAKHSQNYEKRKRELEDEFSKQKNENNRRVTTLQAENKQLSTIVEKQKATINDQAKELEKITEQYDVLERAKDSIKKEKLARETELTAMKAEFALSHNSIESFKRKFAEIAAVIEEMSLKYFDGFDMNDLEKVREQLVAADPCFASVPIDDSDESRDLRAAHAQRIISSAICEYIWKPFRSEFTLSHPEFEYLLAHLLDELEKSSQGGRAANVWTALTMRALQSLSAGFIPPRAPELKETLRPASSSRAEKAVSKVFSVLSPLVGSSQYNDLQTDLHKLAVSAIDVWSDAHNGGLKILINPSLDPAHREEWRSQKFDPALPSPGYEETRSDMISKRHTQIFTLFPRVIAREVADPNKDVVGLPGSWPQEPDQAPRITQTCIHSGIGLPECSSLVVRGKQEQEERNELISKAIENAKKEVNSSRRLTGHGRRASAGSSASVPSSPSQQWKMGGAMKLPEK